MAKAKQSSRSKPRFPEFARDTNVMGVAGKRIRAGEWGGVELERVHACHALAASWTEKRKVPGSPLVATPAGDMHNVPPGPWMGEIAIGYRVYYARANDGHPWNELNLDGMRERIVRAREIEEAVWRSFAETLCPERADEIVAQLATEPAGLMLVASGPLAGGWVGYGILSYEPRPGFEFLRGQDMSQERHATGVVGLLVATADGPSIGEIDLSPEAHDGRVAQTTALQNATVTGPAGPEASPLGYAILATYDSF